MVRNLASTNVGARVVSFSSESKGCEASNVLNDNISKIWLTKDKVPQWICIGFLSASDEVKRTAITTIGWHCWHAYNTNPRMVTVHVSADGSAFKRWDCFSSGPEAGNQLFSCAPITLGIYPYIVLEINDSFGGEETYMNRVYMFAEDLSAIPQPLTTLSTTTLSETNTSALYEKLAAALGSDDEEEEDDEEGAAASDDQHPAAKDQEFAALRKLTRPTSRAPASQTSREDHSHSTPGSSREQRGSMELRMIELEQQLLKLQSMVAQHERSSGTDDDSSDLSILSGPEDQGNDFEAANAELPAAADATPRDSLENGDKRSSSKLSSEPELPAEAQAPRDSDREDEGEAAEEARTVATNTSFATSWAARESSPRTAEPDQAADVGRLLDTMQELRTMMARLHERTLTTPAATPRSSIRTFSVENPAAGQNLPATKEQHTPKFHKPSSANGTPRKDASRLQRQSPRQPPPSSARSSVSRKSSTKSSELSQQRQHREQPSRDWGVDKTPQRREASRTQPSPRPFPRDVPQQQQQQQATFGSSGHQLRYPVQDEAIQTSFAIIQASNRSGSGSGSRRRQDAAVNTSIREPEPDRIFLFDSDYQPPVSELVPRSRDATRRRRRRQLPEHQQQQPRQQEEEEQHQRSSREYPQRRPAQQPAHDQKNEHQRAYESNLAQLRHTKELLENVDNIPSELVELLQQLHSKLLERTYAAARLQWLRRTRRVERSDEHGHGSQHRRQSNSKVN